jgi:pSer/pThr/pTyr-binding forkhead associated (FHA) protein
MKCPNCNYELASGASFCGNCGSRLNFPVETTISEYVSIGRASDNKLVINESNISSHHAKVYSDNGKIFIEDLNSTNGTFVNGVKINKTIIGQNDIVSFGNNYRLDMNIPAIRNLFSLVPFSSGSLANKTSIEYNVHPSNVPNIQNMQQPGVAQQVNVNVINQSTQQQYNPRPVIVAQPKSVGISILLTFLFGPFGMFYSTITGGIIMSVVSIFLALITFGFSGFLTWPICIIWGAVAADQENKKFLLQNQ